MLMAEWNLDDALATRYAEGREERDLEIARNALVKGYSLEQIQEIIGLDLETLAGLQPRVG